MINNPILISICFHEVNMPLTCILTLFFQPLLPDSRLVTSCYVTHHVTVVTCLFIVQEIKKKEKENQKKRNIKSRKIDKKKRKMSVSQCTITSITTGRDRGLD